MNEKYNFLETLLFRLLQYISTLIERFLNLYKTIDNQLYKDFTRLYRIMLQCHTNVVVKLFA